jgi:hypothetical protein
VNPKIICAYCGIREAMPGLVTAECRRCYDAAVDDERERRRDTLKAGGITLLAVFVVGAFVYCLSGCNQPTMPPEPEVSDSEEVEGASPQTSGLDPFDARRTGLRSTCPDPPCRGHERGDICQCRCKPGFVATTVFPDFELGTCPAFEYGWVPAEVPTKLMALWWPDGALDSYDERLKRHPESLGEHPGFVTDPDACTCTCPRPTEGAWPCSAQKVR